MHTIMCIVGLHTNITKLVHMLKWSWIVISIPVGAVPYTSSSARFGRGVDTNLTNFRCYGNESQLLNCIHSVTSSCDRDYAAGVLCYGDIVPG